MDPSAIFDEPPISEEEARILTLMTPKELGEDTTIWHALNDRGWTPPSPSRLLMESLEATLQRLVYDLAWMHIYIHCTDHLDDEELYEQLYDTFRDYERPIWPDDPESAIILHFALHDDDEGETWLRYDASDFDRRIWEKTFPEDVIPPAELPKFRREWIPVRPN